MPFSTTLPLNDRISRFLRHDKDVSADRMSVKPRAFKPTKGKQLSAAHTQSMTEKSIWQWADKHLKSESEIDKRADLKVKDIFSVGLKIAYDNIPPRHLNIIGWPPEKHKELKSRRDLAKLAKARFRYDSVL